MKYKRLTKKGGLNFADKNLSLADEWGYSHIYNRLAELEDKIEQGTLIDTTKYFIRTEEYKPYQARYLICKYGAHTDVYNCYTNKEQAERDLEMIYNV